MTTADSAEDKGFKDQLIEKMKEIKAIVEGLNEDEIKSIDFIFEDMEAFSYAHMNISEG